MHSDQRATQVDAKVLDERCRQAVGLGKIIGHLQRTCAHHRGDFIVCNRCNCACISKLPNQVCIRPVRYQPCSDLRLVVVFQALLQLLVVYRRGHLRFYGRLPTPTIIQWDVENISVLAYRKPACTRVVAQSRPYGVHFLWKQ